MLKDMTRDQLRALCKEHEIKGGSTKATMVAALEEAGIGPTWEPIATIPAMISKEGLLLGLDWDQIWKAIRIRHPEYKGAGKAGTRSTYARQLIGKGLLKDGKTTPEGRKYLAEIQGEGDQKDTTEDPQGGMTLKKAMNDQG